MKKICFLAVLVLPLVLLSSGLKKPNTPDLWQVLNRKADLAFQRHDIEKACKYWQRIIKEDPRSLKVYNKLGIAYLIVKDYEGAIDILRRGLDVDNKNPGLNYNLGLAYYYKGENEKCLGQMEIVLDLNKYYPEAYYLKGLCLENMGMAEESQHAYIEEINHNPGSQRAWKKVKESPAPHSPVPRGGQDPVQGKSLI